MVNPNLILKIICALSICAPIAAHAQSADYLPVGTAVSDGVYRTDFGSDPLSGLRHDVGYRINAKDLAASFVVSPASIQIFAAMAPLRAKMPSYLPMAFKPIVVDITNFINRIQAKAGISAEKSNGLTNWQLAMKITRLSFCFGTDPKGVAAQIFTESKFDRQRVSGTGAVGLTQMTSSAIDEVNDQLGSRSNNGATPENLRFLYGAINCYMGGQPFKPMFEAGVIRRGDLVAKNRPARLRAKVWLQDNVDRDLIYGQITLKVMLGYARADGASGYAAYIQAFKKYNGEPRGRDMRYARENVAAMHMI